MCSLFYSHSGGGCHSPELMMEAILARVVAFEHQHTITLVCWFGVTVSAVPSLSVSGLRLCREPVLAQGALQVFQVQAYPRH